MEEEFRGKPLLRFIYVYSNNGINLPTILTVLPPIASNIRIMISIYTLGDNATPMQEATVIGNAIITTGLRPQRSARTPDIVGKNAVTTVYPVTLILTIESVE